LAPAREVCFPNVALLPHRFTRNLSECRDWKRQGRSHREPLWPRVIPKRKLRFPLPTGGPVLSNSRTGRRPSQRRGITPSEPRPMERFGRPVRPEKMPTVLSPSLPTDSSPATSNSDSDRPGCVEQRLRCCLSPCPSGGAGASATTVPRRTNSPKAQTGGVTFFIHRGCRSFRRNDCRLYAKSIVTDTNIGAVVEISVLLSAIVLILRRSPVKLWFGSQCLPAQLSAESSHLPNLGSLRSRFVTP